MFSDACTKVINLDLKKKRKRKLLRISQWFPFSFKNEQQRPLCEWMSKETIVRTECVRGTGINENFVES